MLEPEACPGYEPSPHPESPIPAGLSTKESTSLEHTDLGVAWSFHFYPGQGLVREMQAGCEV